jgi:DNA polymerase
MGRFAVQALLADSPAAVQGQPLGQLRGQVLRYAGVPLVVTIAPSALLRSPQDKARAWGDWCLASHVVSQAQVAAQVAAQVDARANI